MVHCGLISAFCAFPLLVIFAEAVATMSNKLHFPLGLRLRITAWIGGVRGPGYDAAVFTSRTFKHSASDPSLKIRILACSHKTTYSSKFQPVNPFANMTRHRILLLGPIEQYAIHHRIGVIFEDSINLI